MDPLRELGARALADPLHVVATAIFALAIMHTFLAARFTDLAHAVQRAADAESQRRGAEPRSSARAEFLQLIGEVDVVFGVWAIPLLLAMSALVGWEGARRYVVEDVNYTEPLFVIVVMALASTRPVVAFAESLLRRVAALGQLRPSAWWLAILTVGPVLGSFITEPAAMTICAILLGRRFFRFAPPQPLKYATVGLLFVNISIGGTLTQFAAPPVLMVARPWGWDLSFMLSHFGWRACVAIAISTGCYFLYFRRELRAIDGLPPLTDVEYPDDDAAGAHALLPIPRWVTISHLAFMAWVVVNAHYPVLFLGGFLFFLGFMRATTAYQSRLDLRAPLLVGFFLSGLVIHGGLQDWWITPLLASLTDTSAFVGATILTAFNDNALVTYLATLVPSLDDHVKMAVVQGAVTGGGLTVIANAPNPAGQAILGRFFDGAVHPLRLFAAALAPTVIAAAVFRLF